MTKPRRQVRIHPFGASMTEDLVEAVKTLDAHHIVADVAFFAKSEHSRCGAWDLTVGASPEFAPETGNWWRKWHTADYWFWYIPVANRLWWRANTGRTVHHMPKFQRLPTPYTDKEPKKEPVFIDVDYGELERRVISSVTTNPLGRGKENKQ
jgi:hypothetical protein